MLAETSLEMSLSQALPEAEPLIGLIYTICSSVLLVEKYFHQISTSWKQSRTPTLHFVCLLSRLSITTLKKWIRLQQFHHTFHPACPCHPWGMCGMSRSSFLLRPVTFKLLRQTLGETLPPWLSGYIQTNLIYTCLPSWLHYQIYTCLPIWLH